MRVANVIKDITKKSDEPILFADFHLLLISGKKIGFYDSAPRY